MGCQNRDTFDRVQNPRRLIIPEKGPRKCEGVAGAFAATADLVSCQLLHRFGVCSPAPRLRGAFVGRDLSLSLSLSLFLIVSANDETKTIQIAHKYRHGENGAAFPES